MITVDGPISFLVGGAIAYACRSATGDKIRGSANLIARFIKT